MKSTKRSQQIRQYLLEEISLYPQGIHSRAAKRFKVSKQAISSHLNRLIKEGLVTAKGNTRQRTYSLSVIRKNEIVAPIDGLKEDVLWRDRVKPIFDDLPKNVYEIWIHGFSEMVNNVIDHSEGNKLVVIVHRTAAVINMTIYDDGVGIFRKIKRDLNLEDERHAILELSKGKLTTDPEGHSGEGIFFTSRMFDGYWISSGDFVFSHHHDVDMDCAFERDQTNKMGTFVIMFIRNNSNRSIEKVFDKFSSDDEQYRFSKTIIPVRLVKHGLEQLISRSQAKRLLARIDRFEYVALDFTGVEKIGQAFADEIFRVFVNNNPNIQIVPVHMNKEVKKMINRVRAEK